MEFRGNWVEHPKFGNQLRATTALERVPATAAALQKYLGSGLIKGVGPKTAKKIVEHFGDRTLEVFEENISELKAVHGIAARKLATISSAWEEHRGVRDVMLFLQEYGVSTLFAVKIFQHYGDDAIDVVKENPYRLAQDIYGIGFMSADRVARQIGFDLAAEARLRAGIGYILNNSRDHGHCFLTGLQVLEQTHELLSQDAPKVPMQRLEETLGNLVADGEVALRSLPPHVAGQDSPKQTGHEPSLPVPVSVPCYYAKSLYFDEQQVAKIASRISPVPTDRQRIDRWIHRYCDKNSLRLSTQQRDAIGEICGFRVSILTGGPGCGKTTTTRALVGLLVAMKKRVQLCAPTGRAAQRMTEVIGCPAKTIHRLLIWQPSSGRFKHNHENPLKADFLVVDEVSMLDISIAAALFGALRDDAQLLLIGDPNQLPSVGAGDVLRDLLGAKAMPRFELTEVFRQAQSSAIIRAAHTIEAGEVPRLQSPLATPSLWRSNLDCLFVDAEEATGEQLRFIARAKKYLTETNTQSSVEARGEDATPTQAVGEPPPEDDEPSFSIPDKFRHVDLQQLVATETLAEELRAVLQRIPQASALHHGLTLVDVVETLYADTVPKHWPFRNQAAGTQTGTPEIQVLTPMQRGSAGAVALNQRLQQRINPGQTGKPELLVGDRAFRVGDRVMQRRNNYDLGVFNGDIGVIASVEPMMQRCGVRFGGGKGAEVVTFTRNDLLELSHAYAITIHKSQGSEFDVVIMPVITQHYRMLFRNLIYTGLTRAKRLAIVVGQRRAWAMSVRNVDTARRQTALTWLLEPPNQ